MESSGSTDPYRFMSDRLGRFRRPATFVGGSAIVVAPLLDPQSRQPGTGGVDTPEDVYRTPKVRTLATSSSMEVFGTRLLDVQWDVTYPSGSTGPPHYTIVPPST